MSYEFQLNICFTILLSVFLYTLAMATQQIIGKIVCGTAALWQRRKVLGKASSP
jgi:hypothetical protein